MKNIQFWILKKNRMVLVFDSVPHINGTRYPVPGPIFHKFFFGFNPENQTQFQLTQTRIDGQLCVNLWLALSFPNCFSSKISGTQFQGWFLK